MPWLHLIVVTLAFVACVYELLRSSSAASLENVPVAYEHILTMTLCAVFAGAHVAMSVARRQTLLSSLTFYPLFLLLGLVTSIVARGSAKTWAPATAQWALWANVVGYGLVCALVAACAWSCRPLLRRA